MVSSDAGAGPQALREFVPADITISARERATLGRLADLPGRYGPIVLLPDLSFKPANPFATGLAACFEGHIVPTAIGSSINCGMAMVRTDARAGDMSRTDWRRILEAIAARGQQYAAEQPSLASEELLTAMTAPQQACAELGYSEAELACLEPSGYALGSGLTPQQIYRAVPEFALRGTRLSMGILGGGNHFVEFQKVADIAQPRIAAALKLAEGSVTFTVHSSPPLGPLVSLMYGRRPEVAGLTAAKVAVRKALFHLRLPAGMSGLVKIVRGTRSLPAEEPIGRSYAVAYEAAAASGYVHRGMLVMAVKRVLDEQMGISCELLADLSHNGIWREQLDGREVYLHRHGACAFWPADRFPSPHPYAETGQPAFVGSSMSTPSALFVPGPDAHLTYYSISHGTGRRNQVTTPPAESPNEYTRQAGVEALWSGPGDIRQQLGYQYRPIEQLAEVLEQAGVAKLVSTLTPVASFKIP